jgi:hypothetical protein
MKKAILVSLLFSSLVCAGTVQMSFVSASPVVVVPGMNGDEAGPYTMNVNGQLVPAMCMDDFRGVSGTWTAWVTPVGNSDLSHTVLGTNQTFKADGYSITGIQVYEIEAYIFSEIIQPDADREDLQLAAWALMDPSTMWNVIRSKNKTVENDIADAYNAVTDPNSGFNPGSYQILTDVNGKNQEFIVATPEPSVFFLMGTGLVLAGAIRFSRRSKEAA